MGDFKDYATAISGVDQNGNKIFITQRELWRRFPKAVARKVTAKGVNHFGVNLKDNRIFFVSGYTPEKGMFCDELDEKGRVIPKVKADTKSFRFGGSYRTTDWDALDYAEDRCLGDV